MEYLKVRNWDRFQHYKDRNPPWIKLHREILTSREWVVAPTDGHRTLLIAIMLIAAQTDNRIPNDPDYIQRVAHLESAPDLGWLFDVDFVCRYEEGKGEKKRWPSRYVSAAARTAVLNRDKNKCVFCGAQSELEIDHIVPISKGGTSQVENLQTLCRTCNRKKRTRLASATLSVATATTNGGLAYPETETEKSREETDPPTPQGVEAVYSKKFIEFWLEYPRKEAKGTAYSAWKKAAKGIGEASLLDLILAALDWQTDSEQWAKENGKFIPMPATYLNQRRWEDEKDRDGEESQIPDWFDGRKGR